MKTKKLKLSLIAILAVCALSVISLKERTIPAVSADSTGQCRAVLGLRTGQGVCDAESCGRSDGLGNPHAGGDVHEDLLRGRG